MLFLSGTSTNGEIVVVMKSFVLPKQRTGNTEIRSSRSKIRRFLTNGDRCSLFCSYSSRNAKVLGTE